MVPESMLLQAHPRRGHAKTRVAIPVKRGWWRTRNDAPELRVVLWSYSW
jgi:hypothetical protein